MNFESLLAHPPFLHADRNGNTVSWRAGDGLLRYLNMTLNAGDVTLETGAGLTTLVFAINRCSHTAVVPDQAQVDRILEWCTSNEVPTDTLSFKVMRSESALPQLDSTPLDLVLIDGGHSFPIPFVDWLYGGRRLREGGIIVVDDMNIWTSRLLYKFIAKEPQWHIERRKRLEFFAAKRVSCGPLGEWLDQPYVLRRSFARSSPSMMYKTAGGIVSGAQLARSAIAIAQRRDWSELRSRLAALTAGMRSWRAQRLP